ncbi:NAD(P)/FAD-dependent oxidoreductase [Nocardiopsis sp. NPDC050513]|uniref:NAD(P)/FAD-dependent oxidoreductase n=1 Tax=Nocardiopsis sp. NPDC050513 TaxID=3364338 RepID=UPI00378D4D8E
MAHSTDQQSDVYDVAIMGGGAAGLTLALELSQARPDTSIVVIERRRHPVPEAAHKVGESTVEIAAHYLREVLGLGDHLERHQLDKFGVRVFFSDDSNEDIARRVEIGHPVPPPHSVGSYQLDRGRLENALGQELHRLGIPFLSGRRVQEIDLRPDQDRHRLTLVADGGGEHQVAARWVVDATGRSSTLKRQLGLAKKVGHRANAVWFRIGHPIDIDAWSTDPGWNGRIRAGRRELSTNHLMGPGYWVWLIRLASGAISIGIVTDADTHPFSGMNRFERALDWLREHEPQCAREVERHRDKLQDFRVMKDYSYSCERVMSDERWCLTGEAGVFLDPLYSPGLDLIAIGNGLVTDLVTRALDGEDIRERAAVHDRTYLTAVEDWLENFEKQYVLMGNARIMMAKIIWDVSRYWGGPGLLYFHGMFRRLADFPQIVTGLARRTEINRQVQRFFREWHALDQSSETDTFVRYSDFDFMRRLHIGMSAGLPDQELQARFAANVRFLEQLSGQLVSTVIAECEARRDDEAVRRQVELWEGDAALMGLVRIYREESRENPVSDRWITLKRPERVQQPVG